MKLSSKELKAIGWFMKDRQLKPMLSVPPKMYFRNQSGEVETHDLTGISLLHSSWSSDDQKERARAKKVKTNTPRPFKIV